FGAKEGVVQSRQDERRADQAAIGEAVPTERRRAIEANREVARLGIAVAIDRGKAVENALACRATRLAVYRALAMLHVSMTSGPQRMTTSPTITSSRAIPAVASAVCVALALRG